MKEVIRDQYTNSGNAKRGHGKKRSAARLKMNKSSTSSYDKRYYCEFFSLMNPKVLRSIESLSHRHAEKLCKCHCVLA